MSLLAPGACQGRVEHVGGWVTDITPDTIADVTVTHGRTAFETGRAAISGAQFTMKVYEGQASRSWIGVGAGIRITSGPTQALRHTGAISDVSWSWSEDDAGRFLAHRVTTTGGMARLGATPVIPTALDKPAWPATNPLRERVVWLCRNVPGQISIQSGDFNPNMQPVEFSTDLDILAALEDMLWPGEAVLFDQVTGAPVWQELGYRRTTPTVNLPACAVRWAPEWQSRNDLVNHAQIEYGTAPDGGTRPVADSADGDSWFWFGVWAERWGSGYADLTSAQAKADRIVRRQARPTTVLPSITILPNQLTPAEWAAVSTLRVGDRVRVPPVPDPVPAGVTTSGQVMVVEGWTEHLGSRWAPNNEWTLTLHLSPPVWSMVSRRWEDMAGAWQDQGTKTWDQIGALT